LTIVSFFFLSYNESKSEYKELIF